MIKSLASILFASTLCFASVAFADSLPGPITQERTSTPKLKNARVGRYLYVGTVPKFGVGELDLTVSKMSLTLRATGWITQGKIDTYASQLYKRWEQIEETMKDPRFELHPLVKMDSQATVNSTKAWTKIAGQYGAHVLENRDLEVMPGHRGAQALKNDGITEDYKNTISTAILRYFFNDNTLIPEMVKADNMLRDSLLSPENSQKLFLSHNQSIYTPSVQKAGYVGNLTLVYPIAATVEGPFDQPREGVRALQNYGTIEARWWSDKWFDEFGGLPFILINPAGVAFHGPITNFEPINVWFLRRGYVSHGCHRMDTSDVIELRNILPRNLKDLGKVKLTILNNFDVVDWNNDGKNEVVDVKYYNIPTYMNSIKGRTQEEAEKLIAAAVKPFLIENQMKTFFQTNIYTKKFYKPLTDTIVGAPKYKVVGGVLKYDGVHGSLPLARFESRPNRILQYKELGVQLLPYDDNRGKYPPQYFLNF